MVAGEAVPLGTQEITESGERHKRDAFGAAQLCWVSLCFSAWMAVFN